MSATLHPNYPSTQKWLGERTTCDCGRQNVLKESLMADPKEPGTHTCPECRAESKEIMEAFDIILS